MLYHLMKWHVRIPSMNIVLSHTSSLAYWRLLESHRPERSDVVRLEKLGGLAPALDNLKAAGLDAAHTTGSPLHIMTAVHTNRKEPRLAYHVRNTPLPHGALVAIDANLKIFAASPELCFTQMAALLELPELISLGYEFCGHYALASQHPHGFFTREPLTSITRLRSFIDRSDGMSGAKQARAALRHVLPNARSPMETIVVLCLCLPYRLGGYGMAQPLLNHSILLGKRTCKVADSDVYIPDAFWPQSKVAMEYDSKRWHKGERRIAYDAKRRNVFGFKGLTVVTIEPQQFFSFNEFSKVAHVLAKHVGKRIRPQNDDFISKQFALRSSLLSWSNEAGFGEMNLLKNQLRRLLARSR